MSVFSRDCISQSLPAVALAWRVMNSSAPSTFLSRGSHLGISTAQRLKLVSGVAWQRDAGLA